MAQEKKEKTKDQVETEEAMKWAKFLHGVYKKKKLEQVLQKG